MTRRFPTHTARAAIATAGLAIAMSLAALTGSAAALTPIDPARVRPAAAADPPADRLALLADREHLAGLGASRARTSTSASGRRRA